jgi:hypothetical protein
MMLTLTDEVLSMIASGTRRSMESARSSTARCSAPW